MNYRELTELSEKELEQRLKELKVSYYQQREEELTGKDSNSASLKQLRADIARVNTALSGRRGENS